MVSVASSVSVSIVVVVYDMARELPRTLATLSAEYQTTGRDYEVIVVDNGSPEPVDPQLLDAVPNGRLLRLDPAPPSPARAANAGIAAARGGIVGVLIDGARMVTPGLVEAAAAAVDEHDRVIAVTLAFHLGDEPQMAAATRGYDQQVEDRLLASVDWRSDGYELFRISTFAGSSARGWFGPMGESNALFMHRELWDELGGFGEVFDRPGGGLVNHDLYRRALEAPDTDLAMLLGEASFHQFHGGAATGGTAVRDELWEEYASIRGRTYEPPRREPRYVGEVPEVARHHLEASRAWRERNPDCFAPADG
ncbi:MAG: glycosyltransferase [Acidimicrobiales bacterium]|nr:glycosyltransferase [Acidimicrobiales bacterium]